MADKLRTSNVLQGGYLTSRISSGRTVSMGRPRRINVLLSVAAISALFQCYLIFRNSVRFCSSDFAVETAVGISDSLKEKPADTSREHTLCFRMLVDAQFYTALARHSLSDYIFHQTNIVHDCHNLHFKSFEESFEPFESPSPLGIACDDQIKVGKVSRDLFSVELNHSFLRHFSIKVRTAGI